MSRPRDRSSGAGLLPRMEARPRKDGLITYRYHPVGAKPLSLGTDRTAAIQRVLDMLCISHDQGTVRRLWAQYQASQGWLDLAARTRSDYAAYSLHLLRVFGHMPATDITAPMVARYLRVERSAAAVRANREVSLLSNLLNLAIERGEALTNPCRQVRRNREAPRSTSPERAEIEALVRHAQAKGGQWNVIVMAAEFAALAGSRKAEFLGLHWSQISEAEIRMLRAKQHGGAERAERIEISDALRSLIERLRLVARDDRVGSVFPNRHGNPYTASGFAAMWQKLMRESLDLCVLDRRFTFHDLRAHYTTEHKAQRGTLPDLHASPTTTARIYERSRVSRRKAL